MSEAQPSGTGLLAVDEEPIPVTVLTGFLGSGKTTLLRRLLANPRMKETAVILNEFGEVGLDHLLVESSNEDLVVLGNGCLCCALRNDLVETMRSLLHREIRHEVAPFRRLVIETTGLADPAPIMQTLMSDPLRFSRYRLDNVLATVDAATGFATLERHAESVKQVAVADNLLMTKTDLTDAETARSLSFRLLDLNPGVEIINVVHGEVDPAQIFGQESEHSDGGSHNNRRWLDTMRAAMSEWPDRPNRRAVVAAGHDGDASLGSHVHTGDVGTFQLTRQRAVDWDSFSGWLEGLIAIHGERILRIKGLLNVAGVDRPVVIHGVQHIFHPPVRLEAWPDRDRQSHIVVIARGLDGAALANEFSRFADG